MKSRLVLRRCAPRAPRRGSGSDAGGGGSRGGSAGQGPIPTGTRLEIEGGSIEGSVNGATRRFLGIPYAAAPVGERRWKPPAPVMPWDGVRAAAELGAECPQPVFIGAGPLAGTSEDCLNLNVWAPEPAPESPRPVMVWFHGGAFILGSNRGLGGELSDNLAYKGDTLVPAGDVVLVTINYRLGELGFLAHPALTAEDSRGTSGNYGIFDQQAALRWVKANIRTFGGDRDNVTIFGESAGGIDACAHLAAPDSAGLFHRAIIESGPCGLLVSPHANAEAQGERLMQTVGCSNLACLREKPVENILLALGRWDATNPQAPTWGPVVNGSVLPIAPEAAFARQSDSRARGARLEPRRRHTLHERRLRVDHGRRVRNGTRRPGRLDGDRLDRVPAPARDLSALELPRTTRCAGDGLGTRDVQLPDPTPSAPHGCCRPRGLPVPIHSRPFDCALAGSRRAPCRSCRRSRSQVLGIQLAETEIPLSDLIIGYWTRHATSGDPNGAGAAEWPKYDASGDRHLELDDAPQSRTALLKDVCDFWDSVR